MAEIMDEGNVSIKEEISTDEDTCAIYVTKEDVKDETCGMGKHFLFVSNKRKTAEPWGLTRSRERFMNDQNFKK